MKSVIRIMIAAVVLISLPLTANSQIKLKNKVKKVENSVDNRTDQGIEKGLDAIQNGLGKALKKKDKTTDAQQGVENKGDASVSDQTDQAPQQEQTSLQSYSKYDFVPGEKVILYEDFSQDAVGDFPALWTTDVAGEINNLNIATGNWLNLNSTEGTYWFMKDIDFPKNFIVEFDIVPKPGALRIAADLVLFGEASHSEMDKDGNPGTAGVHIQMEKQNWITKGYKRGSNDFLSGSSQINTVKPEEVNHVIIWVQNRRLRIYNLGAKVLDMPTNIYEGTTFKRMCFKLYRGASSGSYISNIKITTAAPDMRSKLLTEGKLVSYGIYFDVNKDVVKAESYGTLKEVATVLTENPGLRIKIVGHTDADGADDLNLDLSKRRGAAVSNELVKTFGIDASRLESDGSGESQPVAPNDTPSNKALNRRVEFIKL